MKSKLPEWVGIFRVSQKELRLRFEEHNSIIRKGRISLLFGGTAMFTDWQTSILKTIEKEVIADRKKSFSLYKASVINQNLKKRIDARQQRNSRM